eukprot:4878166-Amphidinium_carterae.1
MNNILTLLLELPAVLHSELSLLRLAFFYAERPESDAFALLHAVAPASPGHCHVVTLSQEPPE